MSNLLEIFCNKINYQFGNLELLNEALTHPSMSKNDAQKLNYERLEFLGDKVLGLVIAEFLMQKYPKEQEGALSKRQAALISGATLSKIAAEIGINNVLTVSKGEANLGGKDNKNNLENAIEALIGAIYLDSNFGKAKEFILSFWQDYLTKNLEPPQDSVSKLQELTQSQSKQLPKYNIVKSGGLDHEPIFIANLTLPNCDLEFSAKGKSKKDAQKNVSIVALKHLQNS
jgi:ribonuclease III